MSKKCEKVCTILNYIKHLLKLVFAVTGCVSISAYGSFIGIPIGITTSAVGLKICGKIKYIQEVKRISQLSRKRGKIMLKQCC